MIWAALAAAIAFAIAAAAAGPDHWKELVHKFHKAIKENVKDKDRQAKALAILKAADGDNVKMRKSLVAHFNQAYAVHLNYASTRDDYLAAVELVMTDVNTMEVAVLERRFELKEALTLPEYQAVFAGVQEDLIKEHAKEEKKEEKHEKKEERKEERKAAHEHGHEPAPETAPETTPAPE